MDRSVLEEYAALRYEHDDLKRRINRLTRQADALRDAQVADTVMGSREDLTVGPIKVVGKPTRLYNQKIRQLKRARRRYADLDAQLVAKLSEVEDFIATVESSRVRTILRKRYIDGMQWERISWSFSMSRDWARKTVDNFFAKKY